MSRPAPRRNRSKRARGASMVGTEVVVDVGDPGHGGFCVARHEGRAVFVRHALPGERVVARITEGGADDRFWRADAVTILSASPDRVVPPCPYAAPGQCGGCDWQHAALPAQRRLKAEVVADQLRRLAGIERDVVVEPVEGDDAGLGWRTRVDYAVREDGRAGLRPHRSRAVVPIDTCLIAHDHVRALHVESRSWPGADAVHAAVSSTGEHAVLAEEQDRTRLVSGEATLTERAAGRTWQVSSSGFWQVHPGAADTLVAAVIAGLSPRTGETVLDLYAGVGLFAGAIGPIVGHRGSVLAVEGSRRAVADARTNLADLPHVTAAAGAVDRVLAGRTDTVVPDHVDLVVLDPPRTGAKAAVVGEIAARRPRAVAYVACDPAALARDLATFATHGYELVSLQAFDLFPMTHHVECVALLARTSSDLSRNDSR